jgi:hypothetical protein
MCFCMNTLSWIVRVITKWSPALIAGRGIQSQRLMLVWSCFELEQFAASTNRLRLEQGQEFPRNTLPSAARAYIHAFDFAKSGAED